MKGQDQKTGRKQQPIQGECAEIILEIRAGECVSTMKLIYVIPADAAQASPNGKFSLLGGGVESINVSSFPAVHAGLALVVRLDVLASEAEQDHKCSIDIVGPKDFRVKSGDILEFRPTLPSVPDRPFAINLILNMPLLVFPESGAYDFHLYVDGQEVGEFSLNAQKIDSSEVS